MASAPTPHKSDAPIPGEVSASNGSSLSAVGFGLVRPECVLTHVSGAIFASDWSGGGGIAIVGVDGSVARLTARTAGIDLKPNGIALEQSSSFLVAHLGGETGGLYRLHPDASVTPVLTQLAGRELPPCNFPLIDRQGRIWLTVSTRVTPRADDYRRSASTGFIILIDRKGPRIVADGLGYANECVLSADERYLYVNETFARRLSRFEVGIDGSLGSHAVISEFGPGIFPDGLTLDEDDGLWITSIISNCVIHIAADGTKTVALRDADDAHVSWVEEAFLHNRLGRPHLDTAKGRLLRNASSLAFGGPKMETAYIGSLLGDCLYSFEPGVVGREPPHYRTNLSPLAYLLAGSPQ